MSVTLKYKMCFLLLYWDFFSIYHLIFVRFNKLPMEKVLPFFFGREGGRMNILLCSGLLRRQQRCLRELCPSCWSVSGHRTLRKGFLNNLQNRFSVPFSGREG